MLQYKNALYTTNSNDDGFSISVASILLGMEAELYLPTFKKHNYGKKDLEELSNEDLVIMGVDDVEIREKLLELFKKRGGSRLQESLKFTENDRKQIIIEGTKLMELTRLSLNNCKRNIDNAIKIEDVLVKPNIFATDLMLEVLKEIQNKLKGIRRTLEKDSKVVQKSSGRKTKVLIIGGCVLIAVSACVFKYVKFKV